MVEWFDCHAEFGCRCVPGVLQLPDAGRLAALYGEIGIQRALVVHPSLYQLHPKIGNVRILSEIRGFPQFEPTWAILPPQTAELGGVDAFLQAMREAGVRALWAFPTHGYLLNRLTFAPLFSAMAIRKIPLFVKVEAVGFDWATLYRLLEEVPDLRLVAITTNCFGEDRVFRPLLEHFPHFSLGLSKYLVADGLGMLCARYGAGRFLFGTSFPDVQPGGCQLAVRHAGLAQADLAAVAGGNLRRLLAEVML